MEFGSHQMYQLSTLVLSVSLDEHFDIRAWSLFSLVLLVGYKIADGFSSWKRLWHDWLGFDLIEPVKKLTDDQLTWVHHFYTLTNRCITTPLFIYHVSQWFQRMGNSGRVSWSLLSLLNGSLCQFFITLIGHFLLCFLFYDFIYYVFHRTLHHRWIYGWIHKHHHQQISPFRGTYDGINTHIFEFLFGEYLHLWSLMFCSCIVNEMNGYGLALFLSSASLMASLNHTRFAVRVPWFYDVRDHDVHHRLPTANFGQFIMFWDVLFDTFHEYHDYRKSRQRESKIASELSAKEQSEAKMNPERVVEHPPCSPIPSAAVTGAAGMLGGRLLEMLLREHPECRRLVLIDKVEPNEEDSDWMKSVMKRKENTNHADKVDVQWLRLDITDKATMLCDETTDKMRNCAVVFHCAALVGPYYEHSMYEKVNYYGTLNVIELCKQASVRALVDVSSPSTRYTGTDVRGLSERDFDEDEYLRSQRGVTHEYARTKAMAEDAVINANGCLCNDGLTKMWTSVVAPHQIYGEKDRLFLPNVLKSAQWVRPFGHGHYYVSFTHVDNVCYALLLAAQSLLEYEQRKKNDNKQSKNSNDESSLVPMAAGQFYFVTDDGAYHFWDQLDKAVSLLLAEKNEDAAKTNKQRVIRRRMKLPTWIVYALAYSGLSRTLTPFSVNMTIIDRYFCIGKIKRELGYRPRKPFEEAWQGVIENVVRELKKKQQK